MNLQKPNYVYVPFATFETTVASLDRLNRILNDQKLSLLGETTCPTLDDGGAGVLVKDTVRFQTIVRVFAHKDLGLPELDIRLGE